MKAHARWRESMYLVDPFAGLRSCGTDSSTRSAHRPSLGYALLSVRQLQRA